MSGAIFSILVCKMPGRRRETTIDLEVSDGSDADSYDSADDSEGSLREFLVDDNLVECSDYDDEDTGSDFEAVTTDEDEGASADTATDADATSSGNECAVCAAGGHG